MNDQTSNQPRKTCHRFNDPGHAHELTFSCFQRRKYLAKDRTRNWMIDAIDRARAKYAFHLWAFVIMPEHVHLLIWPTKPEYSVSSILYSLKQSVSQRALVHLKRMSGDLSNPVNTKRPDRAESFSFWQRGGGYDRNLTEPKTIWAAINYIHANPVRRNLCQHAEDWRWSSASEYKSPGTGLLRLDLASLPRTDSG